VLEAARQIDRNEDIRIDQELTNQASGATAARDTVSALSDLLDAQNNFMSVWVNYEALRRSLDLDLGTLQLNEEGIWIDPGAIKEDYGTYDPWLWRCPDQPQACYDGAIQDPVQPYPQGHLGDGEYFGEAYLMENEVVPAPAPTPARPAQRPAPQPQPLPQPQETRTPAAKPAPVFEAPAAVKPPTPVYGPQLDPAAYARPRQPVTTASATMSQAVTEANKATQADYFADSPAPSQPVNTLRK
jgi:hypothetical protein